MKHTPGPWEVRNKSDGTSYFGQVQKLIDDGEGIAINMPAPPFALGRCGALVTTSVPQEEYEANARLIAATPIMYEYIQQKANEGDRNAIKIIATLDI
jgi:hypothetical protein